MIDNLAIGVSHALILYVCWQLLLRDDLDDGTVVPPEAAGEMPTRMSAGARHRAAMAARDKADGESRSDA
ncbi:hypothetical protein QQS45_04035 [Alteriqipengyuania flavescens]|uniref:hypothetical protein n=1 Tax=Alteriqipengyuania flavescens TaxID=3053610 RepID=UPI0025B445BF|nr:hypothetical protein [Alteriqipengyuania flavescens]WJY19408.1 hypothetical protein QQW98_04030 [Alteriqipengyuania flavescens]WJY25350.1 hypothetical protein QQS45_04035 [Alteriqipengyuania flavescens]